MPELPEVETIRRNLAPHLEGRRVESLEILDARWCRPLAPAELAAAVEGRVLERLSRRGKYVIAELEGDVFLLMHLRMTGTLLIGRAGATHRPAHSRVRFGLRDGDEQRARGAVAQRPQPAERAAHASSRATSDSISATSARCSSRIG